MNFVAVYFTFLQMFSAVTFQPAAFTCNFTGNLDFSNHLKILNPVLLYCISDDILVLKRKI